MAINIRHAPTERLAAELAQRTGETKLVAINRALEERLARLSRPQPDPFLLAKVKAIAERVAALPVLDDRSADEILGYDEHGLPT